MSDLVSRLNLNRFKETWRNLAVFKFWDYFEYVVHFVFCLIFWYWIFFVWSFWLISSNSIGLSHNLSSNLLHQFQNCYYQYHLHTHEYNYANGLFEPLKLCQGSKAKRLIVVSIFFLVEWLNFFESKNLEKIYLLLYDFFFWMSYLHSFIEFEHREFIYIFDVSFSCQWVHHDR